MRKLTGNPDFAQVYEHAGDPIGLADLEVAVAYGIVRLSRRADGKHIATVPDHAAQTESDFAWDEQQQRLRVIETRPLVMVN